MCTTYSFEQRHLHLVKHRGHVLNWALTILHMPSLYSCVRLTRSWFMLLCFIEFSLQTLNWEISCLCLSEKLGFLFVVPSSDFGIRVTLASYNELGSATCQLVLRTSLRSVAVSAWKIWQSSAVNPSGPGHFFIGRLLLFHLADHYRSI